MLICYRYRTLKLIGAIALISSIQTVRAEPNRLANESSPYLRQHANNPVDWYPWGNEAFEKARKENKLIFLSIGYATCHWCHVMEHESFEDETIAAELNAHYIPVKIDREERPDVDRIYMGYHTTRYGSGGWPLNLWLTPDLNPIASGTYFPPSDQSGRPGFLSILSDVRKAWSADPEGVSEGGKQLAARLEEAMTPTPGTDLPSIELEEQATKFLEQIEDPLYGGFGQNTKFPQPAQVDFLLSRAAHPSTPPATANRCLEIAEKALAALADGGIHDHLGGGFHRYTVDRAWRVPHFEKMLYDQAQLATSYLSLFQLTQNPRWADAARDIFRYVENQLTSPEGGFYSAEDADSLPPENPEAKKKREGAFYVWTEKELTSLLGSDLEAFSLAYDIKPNGNAPQGTDPHHEFTNQNILYRKRTDSEVAAALTGPISEAAVVNSLSKSRAKLLSHRNSRPRPLLDDKIIAAWNGLMISAYAKAYQILRDPAYLASAQQATDFIIQNLTDGSGKDLRRSYLEAPSNTPGFAEDYAYLIAALLDLYESNFEILYLNQAVALQDTMIAELGDPINGGFFHAPTSQEHLILRLKSFEGSAEPSANAIAAKNLLRLSAMLYRSDYADHASKLLRASSPTLTTSPNASYHLLQAVRWALPGAISQIVIASPRKDTELVKLAQQSLLSPKILLLADGAKGQSFLEKENPAIASLSQIDNLPTLYLCSNFSCKTPTNKVNEVRKLLIREDLIKKFQLFR